LDDCVILCLFVDFVHVESSDLLGTFHRYPGTRVVAGLAGGRKEELSCGRPVLLGDRAVAFWVLGTLCLGLPFLIETNAPGPISRRQRRRPWGVGRHWRRGRRWQRWRLRRDGRGWQRRWHQRTGARKHAAWFYRVDCERDVGAKREIIRGEATDRLQLAPPQPLRDDR
jgi:hypothetical protein